MLDESRKHAWETSAICADLAWRLLDVDPKTRVVDPTNPDDPKCCMPWAEIHRRACAGSTARGVGWQVYVEARQPLVIGEWSLAVNHDQRLDLTDYQTRYNLRRLYQEQLQTFSATPGFSGAARSHAPRRTPGPPPPWQRPSLGPCWAALGGSGRLWAALGGPGRLGTPPAASRLGPLQPARCALRGLGLAPSRRLLSRSKAADPTTPIPTSTQAAPSSGRYAWARAGTRAPPRPTRTGGRSMARARGARCAATPSRCGRSSR